MRYCCLRVCVVVCNPILVLSLSLGQAEQDSGHVTTISKVCIVRVLRVSCHTWHSADGNKNPDLHNVQSKHCKTKLNKTTKKYTTQSAERCVRDCFFVLFCIFKNSMNIWQFCDFFFIYILSFIFVLFLSHSVQIGKFSIAWNLTSWTTRWL